MFLGKKKTLISVLTQLISHFYNSVTILMESFVIWYNDSTINLQ